MSKSSSAAAAATSTNDCSSSSNNDEQSHSTSSSSSTTSSSSSFMSKKRLCIENDDNNNNVIVVVGDSVAAADHSNNSDGHDDYDDYDVVDSKRKIRSSTSTSSSSINNNCSIRNDNKSNFQHDKLRTLSSSSSSTCNSINGNNDKIQTKLAHGRCLYYPGAYSSLNGQLSNQQQQQQQQQQSLSSSLRRQCSTFYCCRCQNRFQPSSSSSSSSQMPNLYNQSININNNNRDQQSKIRLRNHSLRFILFDSLNQQQQQQPQAQAQQYQYQPNDSSLTIPTSSSSSALPTTTTIANDSLITNTAIIEHLYQPESLLEIAARFVAEFIPYEYIEQQYSSIPEPVQKRIIFWSFPRDESYIRLYSSISSIFKPDFNSINYPNNQINQSSTATNFLGNFNASQSSSVTISINNNNNNIQMNNDLEWESRSTFDKGLQLLCSGTIKQVMQIGFNLTGIVIDLQSLNNNKQLQSQSANMQYFPSSSSSSSSSYQFGSATAEKNFWRFIQNDRLMNNNNGVGFGNNYNNVNINNQNIHDPLSSTINSLSYRKCTNLNSCLVSITFDRCKITSVTCTCTPRAAHLFWCEHVVALALYRIHKPYSFDLRIPISETLLDLDRQQLQKLVQYLIAEHHVQILPTVQRLADELNQKHTTINLINGAPDPTAGACVYGPHDWYLNEERTAAQIRDLVKFIAIPTGSNKIILLFYKVIEMLKIKDSNGSRFLRIITEQFLYSYSHYLKLDVPVDDVYFDLYNFLWDHLTNLWIFIVSDPSLPHLKRLEWREMFKNWSSNGPREDTYFSLNVQTINDDQMHHRFLNASSSSSSSSNESMANFNRPYDRRSNSSRNGHNSQPTRNRIFERALEASFISWDDPHLQLILNHSGPMDRKYSYCNLEEKFDHDGFPMWKEHLPTASVRVASLRVNGRLQEAIRLSMAIVRWFRHQQFIQERENICHINVVPSSDSWIGNPLDPIGILFDTLCEASTTGDSMSYDAHYALIGYDRRNMRGTGRNSLVDVFVQYNEMNVPVDKDGNMSTNDNDNNQEKIKLNHIRVAGSSNYFDTYLNAAVYIALIGLTQIRRSPDIDSQRDRSCRQEERLIRKLLDIKLDTILITTIKKHARYLIEYGILSDMVAGEHRLSFVPSDVVQIPGLVRYMFGSLLPSDPDLAYNIGLRSLRFFAFKDENNRRTRSNFEFFEMYLEVQSLLARTMLFAARNDYPQLVLIFETIKNYVIDPDYLNKLAKDIFNFSLNSRNRQEYLLRIAYQFGLHLAKIALNNGKTFDDCRRNTIQWLVTCATKIGYEKIIYLMRNWKEYFNPYEAVRHVASAVLNQDSSTRLCVRDHIMRSEELASAARKLAVECSMKDPSRCAMASLALCEKDQIAFDTIARIVEKAATLKQIGPLELFPIAKYIETQGAYERACKIALLAANQVYIPSAYDNDQYINDLQWTCNLAQCMGTEELNRLVDILIKNVQCASVLADMIRCCCHPLISKSMMINQNNVVAGNNYVSDPSNLVIEHLTLEERLRRRQYKTYSLEQPPLCKLLFAAVEAYIEAIMRRLEHISPRHYSDFIEYLTRAQETIILAPDGPNEFAKLLDKIKTLYKGKKKLMFLVNERFK